jgi:hypothetical protein
MSTINEHQKEAVPIVTDATLLRVPDVNDDKAKGEYLQKIRALRKPPEEVAPQAAPVQETVVEQPDTEVDDVVDEPITDASEVSNEVVDTASTRTRLAPEELADFEIPVTDEDGNVTYLSYDEFNKTVGTYSKQNKKLRELAEREREVEAIKTQLVTENTRVLNQTDVAERKLGERYQWVQNSLLHAHKYGVDTIDFEDGTSRSVAQLVAEKTALESNYQQLQHQRAQAQQALKKSQEDFIAAQDKILEERAPTLKKSRADIAKFLERQGFTSEESNALAHAKAELVILLDKAMKYENAQRGQVKEKKVATNTKVLKQPSRLAGRGTPVNSPSTTRIQELQALGTRANADQLRELRRLQTQR